MTEATGINWTAIISAASLAFLILSTIIGVVWKSLSRLSEKVFQVEIWARDNFVRRDSFNSFADRMEKSVEKIGDKIDERFAELTKRIDEKN